MIRKNDDQNKLVVKKHLFLVVLVFLELTFVFLIISIFPNNVLAGIGGNVTVITRLTVGNVFPEVTSITINGGSSIDLVANDTKQVTLSAVVRDYNGDGDINSTFAVFFDKINSTYTSGDDNNSHYTNLTCIIDRSYPDEYSASVNCTFGLWYYANNATWNATLLVNDTGGYTGFNSTTITVNTLISLGLPNLIDYGTVNATQVSDEVNVSVTNFGNTISNLTLEGYGVTRGDNLSMNCSVGTIKNISIGFEKYNLTSSNISSLSLSQFESIYKNLTSNFTVKKFDLPQRFNDDYNEAVKSTYWRIYVPSGVAGNCSGNIIFGGIRANGSS
jgi:hypothetical protein